MIQELSSLSVFKPFPAYADREAWSALTDETKTWYVNEAKKLAAEEWESLPATMYLDFVRNGDRTRYEGRYFGRRLKLFTLLLAECIEGKGEFLDAIINGVWLISEETSWEVPAHIKLVPYEGDGLPNIEGQMPIDIMPGDTGTIFSLIYYFLGDTLAVKTPLVKRRMELEVERRLLAPYLQYDNYFWDNGPVIHNHNTWTNEHMLVCYLTFNKFPRSLEGINKCIRSINKLLNHYPEDGGCDEGPSYYDKAAGAVIDIIEILSTVSDVSYLWKMPKIRNMVSYLYHAYIGGEYFVNYADAAPRIKWGGAVLERAGKHSGDETLLHFVAYLKASGNSTPETVIRNTHGVFRDLLTLFGLKESGETGRDAALFKPPAASWYPGMETVYAREPWTENGPKGFFFSAKGHHNRVNHNHNDCGNFILYLDAKPVIIDAGVETYTSKTFAEPERYSLWTMRSIYHNVPTINNVEQKVGMQYKA
jgi:hypothetical protein